MELNKDYDLTVGLRIRKLRESLGLTKEAFSERCGISIGFLNSIENGQKGFSSRTLYKLSTATNVSADYFIHGSENGMEIDVMIGLIESLDKTQRESALRILSYIVQSMKYSEEKAQINYRKKDTSQKVMDDKGQKETVSKVK